MHALRRLVLPAAAAAAIAVPLTSSAATTRSLKAVVGPGFTISLTAGKKKAPMVVQPGRYTITVYDKSNIHNFHLIGPGVNKKTGVKFKGKITWHLRLKTGSYRFVCDPHKTIMKGRFTVSNF